MFATVTWITDGDGNWSVGSNWSTGNVPGPNDTPVIDISNIKITVTYDNPAVLSLNNIVNDDLLVLAPGSGGATWTGGTWDGSGFIDNLSTLAISGSAEKILKDGQTYINDKTLTATGTTTVTGTGNIIGQVGATINNLGFFDVQSDMEITFPTGIGDGNFNNQGTFQKSAGGLAAGDMTEIGGAQGFTFNNTGLCQVLVGTLGLGDLVNTSVLTRAVLQVSSGATLDYLRGNEDIPYAPTGANPPYIFPAITGAGTLLISGGNVQHYGVFDINTLDMESGSLLLQQNMTDPNGTPQLITSIAPPVGNLPEFCPAGNVNDFIFNGGTFGGNGGGIFTLGQATTFNTPADPANMIPAGPGATSSGLPIFTLNPGTYELPGLIVENTFSWTGGTFSGTGRLEVDASVINPTITTTNAKTIAGGYGLDLLEQVIWTGSGTIGITGGSAIWIQPAATLWDQNNGTISGEGSNGNLWNSGIFLKEDGTGTTLIDTGIDFQNAEGWGGSGAIPEPLYQVPTNPLPAVLHIVTGTIAFNGDSTNTDNYTIEPGATLSFLSGNHINGTNNNLNNPAKIIGTNFLGTINFGNLATFTGDARARLDVGTTNFGAGTYDFNNLAGGAQVIHAGTFSGGATGTIGGNGTLEIKNSFLWNSGSFVGTGSGTSSLLVDSGAVLTLATGNYNTSNSYSVDNRGTIQWATSPGTLSVGGNFDQTTSGIFNCEIVGPAIDSLMVSGTISLAGTFNLTISNLTPFGGELFTVIDNTGAGAISGTYVGLPEGTVFAIAGDTFQVSYVAGDGNDMVLTAIVLPTVTILTPPLFLRAESGVTFMDFTVQLSSVGATSVSVNYTTTRGTAVPGVDYTTTSGTLTIPAGQLTGTIAVPIIGTSNVEGAVTFTVTISNVVNGKLGSPSTAIGTIVAPNGPPALSFSPSAYIVDEAAGTATVIVISSNSRIASSVSYTTVDGTGVAGVDYTATSGILEFAVGVSQLTISVPIIDRGLTTGQSVFSIQLSNPGNGAILGTSVAAVAILDDDHPKPTLSISDTTVTEFVFGQTQALFTLTLSAPSTSAVSVQYATANGTAVEGKYVPEEGTITFQPNQTTAQISVGVNSDFVQTTSETFSVNLFDPINATLANTSAIGTILSQPLTTVTIEARHPFRYLDAFGRHTTISLSGPGTGVITYLGPTIVDGKQIVLNDTTTKSQLNIRTDGGPGAVVNIIVNGSIRAINAAAISLLGDLTVTGAVQTIHMRSLTGNNTVTVGSGAGIPSLHASFFDVTNASLNSAIPLAALSVSSWMDTTGGSGITAPSANAISSAHDFGAAVSLTGNLGSMVVHGILNGATINVGGNINSVVAGRMQNSDIFAGVLAGTITLPSDVSQFVDTTSTIKRLAVTGRGPNAFADTLIAAPIISRVQLGAAEVSNNGTPFGVVGQTIALAQGIGTRRFALTNAKLRTTPFSDHDLVVHLLG